MIDSSAVPDGRHSRLRIVEIHARAAWGEAIPEDRYAGVARLIAPAMPRVVAACSERWLRVWRPRPGGKPFHNRRILTNHAGLSGPWGRQEPIRVWPTRDDTTANAQVFRSERGLRPRNRLWGEGSEGAVEAPSE